MKLLHTIVVFDRGNVRESKDWKLIHKSYVKAIKGIENPEGSGTLTIRKKESYDTGSGKNRKKQWKRNGVGPLRKKFLNHIVNREKWKQESQVLVEEKIETVPEVFDLYPTGKPHKEPEGATFGNFDFFATGKQGHKVAIEWETGNVSSSHRSLNKLCICLEKGLIMIGVLIVPSRLLYAHLTDRIGNIYELTPYLQFWKKVGETVKKGLLVISVVEHDQLTTEQNFPYLKVERQGRSNAELDANE